MSKETIVRKCLSCMNDIGRREKTIKCDGACNNEIHYDCAHLADEAIQIIERCDNIHYICDSCSSFSLRAINNKLDGIYNYLYELRDNSKKSEKKIEEIQREMSNMNVQMKSLNEKSKKEGDNQRDNSSSDNATTSNQPKPVNKKPSAPNTQQDNNKNSGRQSIGRTVRNVIKANTPKATTTPGGSRAPSSARAPITITPKVSVSSTNTKSKTQTNTGANVKKSTNNPTHETITKPPNKILIKPKQNSSIEQTICDLTSKVNPQNVNFSGLTKRKDGSIVIECTDSVECDDVRNKIESELGSDYDITNIENMKPRIKIFGMNEEISKEILVSLLKEQNESLKDAQLDVLKVVRDVKDKTCFNAIIQVDSKSFSHIMKTRKLKVNWNICQVREHYSIMRCHKCAGFDHTHDACTAIPTCGYCNGCHLSNECDSQTLCCPNCTHANTKMKLSLDTKHNAWSRKCETLTRKIKRVTQKIDYSKND